MKGRVVFPFLSLILSLDEPQPNLFRPPLIGAKRKYINGGFTSHGKKRFIGQHCMKKTDEEILMTAISGEVQTYLNLK